MDERRKTPVKKPRTRGPSPEKTARTRAMIIDAARTAFLCDGFAATTMASVARRAGVAKGTLYLYFRTKEDLFAEMVRELISNPMEQAEHQEIHEGESVAHFLKRSLLPVMRDIENTGRSTITRLVLSEGVKFPFIAEVYRHQVFDPFAVHLKHCLELADERGELSNRTLLDYPHLLAAPLWMGLVNNGVISPDNPISLQGLFEVQIDLCFPGKRDERWGNSQ